VECVGSRTLSICTCTASGCLPLHRIARNECTLHRITVYFTPRHSALYTASQCTLHRITVYFTPRHSALYTASQCTLHRITVHFTPHHSALYTASRRRRPAWTCTAATQRRRRRGRRRRRRGRCSRRRGARFGCCSRIRLVGVPIYIYINIYKIKTHYT
jgi:hypothetical protein